MTEAALENVWLDKEPRSLWRDALHRLVRNKLAVVGMVILGAFAVSALFAGPLSPYDPLAQEILRRNRPGDQREARTSGELDAVAAAVILQRYLDSQNAGLPQRGPCEE